MYLGYLNDRKELGFKCLRDIEAGKQITAILETGVICITIAIFINSSEASELYLPNNNTPIERLLKISGGNLGKLGPGARGKAEARRNAQAGKFSSGSILIPGANIIVPQQSYCRYHENAPLSCKPKVKVSDGPFQGDGDNNQPPPEDGKFDASEYKGGPNPFIGKFDYDNPKHIRENTDFNSQKRMSKTYES